MRAHDQAHSRARMSAQDARGPMISISRRLEPTRHVRVPVSGAEDRSERSSPRRKTRYGTIRVARKSLTLVSVGPVTTSRPAPRRSRGRRCRPGVARGSMPSAQARASVSGVSMRAGDLLRAVDAVGVAGERVDAGWPSSAMRQRQQELDVAAAAALAAHRHRGLAAGQQHARRRERLAARGDLAARCRPCAMPTSRASPSRLSPRMCAATPASRATAAAASSARLRRGDHARSRLRARRGSPGLTRSRRAPASSRRAHGGGQRRCCSGDDGQRVGAGGRVGDGRAGGDVARVVAGHVGDQQRHDARRMARRRASRPPLMRRQVPAHAVHLADGARRWPAARG